MKLSLVIPTYNERDSIQPIVARIRTALDPLKFPYEILVVDDDSPDGTAEAAREALWGSGRVLVRRERRGLASAILEGFENAAGEILGTLDADGSHPPEKIPDFLNPLLVGNADLVIASRYVLGGDTVDWTCARRFLSRTANFFARSLTPVHDATSGCFFLKRSVIAGVPLNIQGFKIALEILVKGRHRTCCEIPYSFQNRRAGLSKMGLGVGFSFLAQMARLHVWRLQQR